ncbi:ABC transporter substrate-binding protein [Anaerosacchariphilus polymeriproducens]|uniref:ABC transporter substrate-binding protein n=1 Tax=Anaerosacchariphilus polymeriproducens TaxID=1812858 RepID=UPI0013903255|nr:ABC transporter substrate-binding protein [Anaerosacchariphilus polymeriproducens]
MKKYKILCILCCVLLTSCQNTSTVVKPINEVITIPAVFLVNPETNQSIHKKIVEEFNEAYKGQYCVEAEWLTDTEAGYRNKIKQLNALDEMPAIITDVGFDSDFNELLIQKERLVDLKPYIQNSKEWLGAMQEDILKACTEDDGSIYLSSLGNPVHSYAGFVYNKELLKRAGVERFPKTWEEFWECLDKLKECGITPLALHGSGTYWVPMLIATSYISGTPEGMNFLKQKFPDDYAGDSFKQILQMLKKLFLYTYDDALDIEYAQAEQRFLNNQAAIIANGYWINIQMDEQSKEKFGFAAFPQNTLMVSPRMSAWAVTAGYDKKVTDGAVKFLEFRVLRDQKESQQFLGKQKNSIFDFEYKQSVKEVKNIIPNYQINWEQKIQNEFFTENLPFYIRNEVSEENILVMLNQLVSELKSEK